MASTLPQVTVAGASAAGAGTTIDFLTARSSVSMAVIPLSTVSGGIVAMEASQDNTNWVAVYIFDLGVGGNQFYSVTNGAFRYWRGNVHSAVTGGGTVRVTLMEAN
jgi:hypothetical protein